MTISLTDLQLVEPTQRARRLFWHVLSIGCVTRDEPERHQGLDKAGVFAFHILSGTGRLRIGDTEYALQPGDRCWLLDLRLPRTYLPDAGQSLRSEGVRFSGPVLESWLELLQREVVFDLIPGVFAKRLRSLTALVSLPGGSGDWSIHTELTNLWGDLFTARGVLDFPEAGIPAPVAMVLETVLAEPYRDWRVGELVAASGISYSRLRELFRAAQGQTLKEFLVATRLETARRLLSDPRLQVREVAERMQFSSEFYFSHFFQRETGMSPSDFRSACRF